MNKLLSIVLLLFLAIGARAAEEAPAAVTEAARMVSPHAPDSVRPAPLEGFYEVVFGAQLVYVSADGRYVLVGQIYDTEDRANLTEARKQGIRLDMLEEVGKDTMIRFAPEAPSHEVYVFTDTHCGYCRKLHSEVGELNDLGVAVNYLAYPAISPKSRPDAIAVWCADDQQQAMTRAKAGKPVEPRQCDNPVDEHKRLGESLGVRGTPAIITETGEMLPGYVPAKRLAQQLRQGDQ